MRAYLVLLAVIVLANCDMNRGDKGQDGVSCIQQEPFPLPPPVCHYDDGSLVPPPTPIGHLVVSSIENSLALQQWAEDHAKENLPHSECERLQDGEYDVQSSDVRVVLHLHYASSYKNRIIPDTSKDIFSAKKEVVYGHQNIKDNLLQQYKVGKLAKFVKNNSDACSNICNELHQFVQVYVFHEGEYCELNKYSFLEPLECLSGTWVTGNVYPNKLWFGEVTDRCELKLKYTTQ